ncbi:MAG: cupin domain-containing protein [Ktedonobacterales bacterium]|nr:cupin domain-containing protein [Ktedonobacterales bacterium]
MSQPTDAPPTGGAPGNLIAFDLRTLTTFQDDGPSVRVLSDIGAARTVLFAFKAGQHLRDHRTSSQALMQVLRGRITLTVGDVSVRARVGTLLQLEADVTHSLVADTSAAVVLLTLVPSPARHSLDREVFAHIPPLVARTPSSP